MHKSSGIQLSDISVQEANDFNNEQEILESSKNDHTTSLNQMIHQLKLPTQINQELFQKLDLQDSEYALEKILPYNPNENQEAIIQNIFIIAAHYEQFYKTDSDYSKSLPCIFA